MTLPRGLINRRALALLLFLTTFTIYLPCVRGAYLWDDDAYISQNQALTTVQGLKDIWLKPGSVQQYYPVTFTLFWIEYHLWGLNPAGYHAVNILLHGLNAVLVAMVLEAIGIPGAWIAAWLFALHPVMTESVAWMTELKNVLSTFFYLLTVLGLLKNLRAERRTSFDTPTLVLFLCALLSKSVTVTLPVVFVLLALWVNKSWDKTLSWRMVPLFIAGFGMACFTIYFEHHLVRAQGTPWALTVSQRLMIAGKAFWFYLGKLIYPHSLAFIYPKWAMDPSLTNVYAYGILALLFLALSAYGQRWWGKMPFACLLFFAVSLVPALGFTSFYFMRFSFVADHFQYLASLGIFALAGWMISNVLDALQISPPSPFGLIILVLFGVNLGLATNRQARTYRDSISLWQHTLDLNPDSAIAHHNMGIALLGQGHLNEGVAHLRTAEALDPSFPQTHLALAYLALHANRRADARHQYEEAIRLGVTDPVVLKDFASINEIQ